MRDILATLASETTPKAITGQIREFCRQEVGIESEPFYVPVRPELEYHVGECHENTRIHVANNGGNSRQGWIIWAAGEAFIEAEHHSVWVSPDGEFIDVTPKPEGETAILFLPDRDRFDGTELISNVRKAFMAHPIFDMNDKIYLETFKRRNEHFKRTGMTVPGPTQRELNQPRVSSPTPMGKVGRNDPCPCGSGRKHKKCCG